MQFQWPAPQLLLLWVWTGVASASVDGLRNTKKMWWRLHKPREANPNWSTAAGQWGMCLTLTMFWPWLVSNDGVRESLLESCFICCDQRRAMPTGAPYQISELVCAPVTIGLVYTEDAICVGVKTSIVFFFFFCCDVNPKLTFWLWLSLAFEYIRI